MQQQIGAGPGPGPGPGGQGGNHERRFFLAMMLCAAVTIIFLQRLQPPPLPESALGSGSGSGSIASAGSGSSSDGSGSGQGSPLSAGSGSGSGSGSAGGSAGSGSGSDATPSGRPFQVILRDREGSEKLHALESEAVSFRLSNHGARLISARLKKRTRLGGDKNSEAGWLPITPGWGYAYEPGSGKPKEAPSFGLELRFGTTMPPRPDLELWRQISATATQVEYRLRYAIGLELVKIFTLGADGRTLTCVVEMTNKGNDPLLFTASHTTLGGIYRESTTYSDVRALVYPLVNGSNVVEKDLYAVLDAADEATKAGRARLTARAPTYPVQAVPADPTAPLFATAVGGKYFAAVVKVKRQPGPCVLWLDSPRDITAPPKIIEKQADRIPKDYYDRTISCGTATLKPLQLARLGVATFEHSLEVGTCDELEQRPYDGELVNYGMFGPISKLLIWTLRKLSNMFASLLGGYDWAYGLAIIVLTLLVKVAMHPLIRRGQLSMAEFQEGMKKIQPELDELRKKHANNPGKQNEEMVKLYKKHDMQMFPLGGCLPMFLQMPIFLGLFYGLGYSIELRGHGFWWIADLALPDRLIEFENVYFFIGDSFNILPILMTIVWFLQQQMMPAPADPNMAQQQKIMKWMPVMFGFMLYNFASGLCLYWFTSNLVGIAEQRGIKAEIERRKEEAAAGPIAASDDAGTAAEAAKLALSPADKAAGKGKKKGKKKRK